MSPSLQRMPHFRIILAALVLGSATAFAESPFERELKLLRDQRDKAIAAADDPINRRYQAALEQLLKRATQASDLASALKIKEELTSLAPAASGTPATSKPSLGSGARSGTKRELLNDMVWHGAIPVTKEASGVFLQAEGSEVPKLETPEFFSPPFKLTARVITDITETRIHYGKGVLIFNWANKPDQIRVHDLLTAGPTPFPNEGLKAGKEHVIVFEVGAKHVSLTVSGKHIYSANGDFSALKYPLAIGPAMGSKIHVLSFAVEP